MPSPETLRKMKDLLGKNDTPHTATQKIQEKKGLPAYKYRRDTGVKSKSIFEYKIQNASEMASEIIHADLMNHGYRIVKSLGEGAYAKVKLADVMPSRLARNQTLADVADGGEMQVAVKIINKKVVPKDFLKKFLPRELENHSKLPQHKHIVRLFEHFSTEDHEYMIMEYCPRGDLLDLINRHIADNQKGIGEELSRKIFTQICKALQHIHNHRIVHRDLKCENVLLDENKDSKLTDFGFSSTCDRDALLKTSCGSYAYTAPEVIRSKPYNGYSSDLWSMGILLFAMVNGRLPFNDNQLIEMEEEMKMQRLRFERNVSFDCMLLIRKLLQYHPAQRPSLEDVLEDHWISGKKPIPRQITKPKWINPYGCDKKAGKDDTDTTALENAHTPRRSTPVCYKASNKVYAGSPTRTVTLNQKAGETVTLKTRCTTKPGPKIPLRPNTWPKTQKEQNNQSGRKGPDIRHIAQLIHKERKIGDQAAGKGSVINKQIPLWFMYKILESEKKELESEMGDASEKQTNKGDIVVSKSAKADRCSACKNDEETLTAQSFRMSSSAGKSKPSDYDTRSGFPVRRLKRNGNRQIYKGNVPVPGSKKQATPKSATLSYTRQKSAPTNKAPERTETSIAPAHTTQKSQANQQAGDSKDSKPVTVNSVKQQLFFQDKDTRPLPPLMGQSLVPCYFKQKFNLGNRRVPHCTNQSNPSHKIVVHTYS